MDADDGCEAFTLHKPATMPGMLVQWKLFELAPFMLIGATGGLVGAFINKYNVK